MVSAVRNALQAPPFPLRLRPFRPPPRFLQKPDALRLPLGHSPPPSEGRDHSGEVEGVPCVGSCKVSPTPSRRLLGGGGWASTGASNLAASSLPGVGAARSSHSQESLVLTDTSPVYSSIPAGGDRRSSSRGIGGSTRDRYRSRSSRLSPSQGRDCREERRCARSWSRGVACPVSGVALLRHGSFAIAWMKALSL